MGKDYFRKFINLEMEGRDKQKVFGTATIESRAGVGKINVNVENVRPMIDYIIELVKVTPKKSTGVPIGIITSDNRGHGKLKCEVDGDKINVADFDVIILKIKNTSELITPLVGYYNEKVQWRSNYSTTMKKEKEATEQVKEEMKEPAKKLVEEIKKEPIKKVVLEEKTEPLKPEPKENKEEPHMEKHKSAEKPVEKISSPQINKKETTETLINDLDSINLGKGLEGEDIFIAMVEKLKNELKELKKITEEDKPPIEEGKTVYTDSQSIDINYYMDNSKNIMPFEKQSKDVSWREIDLDVLALLPGDNYKLIRNNYFRNSYKRFGKLILGKYIQDGKEFYLVGVPDYYNSFEKNNIVKMGFIQFKCMTNIPVREKAKGYWIKPLYFENIIK